MQYDEPILLQCTFCNYSRRLCVDEEGRNAVRKVRYTSVSRGSEVRIAEILPLLEIFLAIRPCIMRMLLQRLFDFFVHKLDVPFPLYPQILISRILPLETLVTAFPSGGRTQYSPHDDNQSHLRSWLSFLNTDICLRHLMKSYTENQCRSTPYLCTPFLSRDCYAAFGTITGAETKNLMKIFTS